MKKILIPILSLALIFMVVPAALASSASQSDEEVTVGDLTYNCSPNVMMDVETSSASYCITSANSLTDTNNGMEYATTASATGYAQQPKTTDATGGPTACADAESIPDGDWTWMGGS